MGLKRRNDRWIAPARTLPLALIIALLTALVPLPASGDPGDLDPTFGTVGRTTTNVAMPRNLAHAVEVQTDGRVLIAGTPDGMSLNEATMAVTRFNTDGTLDDTFGSGGTTLIGIGARSAVNDMILQSNGKIVVAGFSGPFDDEDFAIARLTNDGDLDDTFSNDGKMTVDFYGDSDVANAIGRDGNGNYVLGGSVYDPARNEGDFTEGTNFGLTRVTDTGSHDTAFGSQGKVQTDIGSAGGNADWADDELYDLVIQSSGAIVTGGSSEFGEDDDSPFTLVRYTSTGSKDDSFDGDGIVTTFFGDADYPQREAYVRDLTLHEGNIVAVGPADVTENGNSNGTFSLARYSQTNGTLDSNFGTGGKVSVPVGMLSNSYGEDTANAVLIDEVTDKITVGGSDSGLDLAVIRLTSSGALDTSAPGSGTEFGTAGVALNDVGGGGQMGDQILDLAVDPGSGKFVGLRSRRAAGFGSGRALLDHGRIGFELRRGSRYLVRHHGVREGFLGRQRLRLRRRSHRARVREAAGGGFWLLRWADYPECNPL